jgi:hypothetical protein
MRRQLTPSNRNMRAAEERRKDRVMGMMDELSPAARAAINDSLGDQDRRQERAASDQPDGGSSAHPPGAA